MSTGRPPGRPASPQALKVIRGTERPGSGIGHASARNVSRTPSTPTGLGAEGRRAWRLYWTHGRAWLAETDRPLVERLCRLVDDVAAMRAVIATEGLTGRSRSSRRSSVHPLHNQVLGLSKQISALEAACGFTPADRARLRFVEAPDDAIARWERSAGGGR